MKLLKKYLILELITVCLVLFAGLSCETQPDSNCVLCTDCLLELNEGTYCDSDFDSEEAFNEALKDLEVDNCTCI